MQRYLFHLFNDDQTVDVEGKLLPNLDAARDLAVNHARSIMADELRETGQINLDHWIEIEDENGEMTVVAFRDAVTVEDSSKLIPSKAS